LKKLQKFRSNHQNHVVMASKEWMFVRHPLKAISVPISARQKNMEGNARVVHIMRFGWSLTDYNEKRNTSSLLNQQTRRTSFVVVGKQREDLI
jgi:hypothetical protein